MRRELEATKGSVVKKASGTRIEFKANKKLLWYIDALLAMGLHGRSRTDRRAAARGRGRSGEVQRPAIQVEGEPTVSHTETRQQHEARIRNCSRMVNVFGHREMEIAAIAILDAQWDRPFDPVNVNIFTTDEAKHGFRDLQRGGWIKWAASVPRFLATRARAMMRDYYAENGGRGALLSADGRYRYRLWRLWDDLLPIMVWVMLNPSTADADVDDPTIRKCVGFAKANGYGGIIVVNLFAWRATDPKELPRVADPVGPENDEHILWACRAPLLATIVAGWGCDKFSLSRATRVKTLIYGAAGRQLQCFRKSVGGRPYHPLYLPYAAHLVSL
jgi:hypothetical protein